MGLAHLGKYNESIKFYDKAIEEEPKNSNFWNAKGWALFHLRNYSEAIRAYDNATKLDPKFAKAWNNKGLKMAAPFHV